MPTLLIINVTCNQGSTGKISEQTGLLMKERGWNVYYAHGARRVNPSQLTTIPFSTIRQEYLHALKSLFWDGDGLGSARATRQLTDIIREINPDIVQIHNIHGYYLNIKELFGYLNTTTIPVVITLHDCWNLTGHCTHFVTAGCHRWQTGCHHCPLTSRMPKRTFIDMSERNYAIKGKYISSNPNIHFVAVSDWMARNLRLSMYKEHPIHTIKNGIDLEVFKPCLQSNHERFTVLGVANVWDRQKGLYDIIRLRALLPSDISILLVGLTARQIKHLPSGITGITNTSDQHELARIYSEADVLINPTYADTYPTCNLESIACGTPVITYDTGGSPESVTTDTGKVVRQGDVDQLAEAIIKMKESNFKASASSECTTYAQTHFRNRTRFMEYAELYEQLLSNP